MMHDHDKIPHKMTSILLIMLILLATSIISYSFVFDSATAEATEEKRITKQIEEEKNRLENIEDEYNKYVDLEEKASEEKNELTKRIAETEAQVTASKNELSDLLKWRYRNDTGVLDVISGSDSLNEIITSVASFKKVNDDILKNMAELSDERNELINEKDQVTKKESEASDAKKQAKKIMNETSDAVRKLENELMNSETSNANNNDGNGNTEKSVRRTKIPSHGDVVDYAMSRIGCPYVWGASGPDSFDCSGLVVWSYSKIGIDLPHYTESLYAEADEIVPLSEAEPGDVLYRPGHVGICTEKGAKSYVHAPTFGALVRDTDTLSWSGFTCALRFKR